MTLIIGIKCSDGVVIGADSAATLGSLGNNTVRQPTTKLKIIESSCVVGVSGPVGLGQRIEGEIQTLWSQHAFAGDKLKPFQAGVKVRDAIWPHLKTELEVAATAQNTIGPLARQSALSQTLLALPLAGGATLFQFDQQGAPEEASDELPFIALGSGQPIADPFLAFLRRIYWPWPSGLPTLADGVFVCVWTMEHAILTNPGGVAGPLQMVVLQKEGAKYRASELADEELQEHRQAVADGETALRDFRTSLGSAPASPGTAQLPQPPAPGS